LVGGAPSGGDISSSLWERGETGAWVYQEDMLHGVAKPVNMTLFSSQEWVFQQHSAPAHIAKTTQEWLWRNVLAFISAENWPLQSPNLNPLDCKLWAVLKDMACQKRHNNLKSLRDPSWRQQQKSPWRKCVWWQQSGQNVSRLVLSRGWPFWVTLLWMNKT
jgi:hypothetical protein